MAVVWAAAAAAADEGHTATSEMTGLARVNAIADVAASQNGWTGGCHRDSATSPVDLAAAASWLLVRTAAAVLLFVLRMEDFSVGVWAARRQQGRQASRNDMTEAGCRTTRP